MKLKFISLLAVGALAAVAIGCGSDDPTTSGMPMNHGGNQVDAMFVTGMIPHHEAAVEMAELGVKQGEHPEIRSLSKAIIASQTAEIKQLNDMRSTLSETDGSMMSGEDMMEMEDQVASLKDADDFDMAFIDAMIPHHQSAVMMANQQISEGSDPEVTALSRAIVKAQSKEIAEMQSWRKEWYGSPLPTSETPGAMHGGH